MERGIRSFIAVEIPEEIAARIDPMLSDLEGMGRQIKVVKRENLHFTIKFLGNIPEGMIEQIGEAMRSVQDMLGFDMTIGGFGAFPNARRPRVLWIGTSSEGDMMVKLTKELDRGLGELGFPKERSYVPHLTLARSRDRRGDPALGPFVEKMRDLEIGTMHVERLALKKSVLTPKGPIYSDLLIVGAGEEGD